MGKLGFIKALNPFRFIHFTRRCASFCGSKFLLYLTLSYFSLKGYTRTLISLSELPYYELSGQDSESYQLNRTISHLPWSLKGFIGVVSDIYPLFGYYKKYYLHIYTVIGIISSIVICLLPYEAMEILPELPALVFFCIQFQIAAHDLLNEGKFVSIMNIYPESKADIVTYHFLWQTIGSIIPSVCVGIVADNFDMRYLYISMIPLCGHPIVTMLYGCFPEEKVPNELANRINMPKLKREWRSMLMASSIATLALGSIIIGILASNLVKFIYTICAAISLGSLGYWTLPIMAANANLYIFLCDTLYTDIQGPLDYFYVADDTCVPDGPAFGYAYYRTYTSLIGILATMLGLYLFQTFFINMKMRHIFWSTTAIRVIAAMVDIVLVKRWNTLIGIPDTVMYLLGNAIIYNAAYIMDYMPMITLIAKLCPEGVETTMYSILAGFANFGVSLAGYNGLYFAELFNVKLGDNIECSYQNLPWLIFLAHVILPLLNLPLTFILIPSGYFSDNFEENRKYKNRRENDIHRHKKTESINNIQPVIETS